MMEIWLQITCNGCGETDNSVLPNQTKAEFRTEKRNGGWRRTTNDLDYCGKCVEKGALKKLPNMFGAD